MANCIKKDRFTLANLARDWGFSFGATPGKIKEEEFCKKIFPDYYSMTYDSDVAADAGWQCLNNMDNSKSNSSIRAFLGGNMRKESAFAYERLSIDLLDKLLSDEGIIDNCGNLVTHRISMLQNIRKLMEEENHRIDGSNHKVFTHYAPGRLEGAEKTTETQPKNQNEAKTVPGKVQTVINMLLEKKDRNHRAYALFLMVLASIYHEYLCSEQGVTGKVNGKQKILMPKSLLMDDVIEKSITAMDCIPPTSDERMIDSVINTMPGFEPFTDIGYMNSYNIYLLRTSNTLFDSGMLEMRMDESGIPTAELCLQFDNWRQGEKEANVRKYRGIPMRMRDQVQINLFDDDHEVPLTIYFRYDPFSWMYFRSALVVRRHPLYGVPIAQRAFITYEKAKHEELAAIRGALQLPEETFVITEIKMKQFLEDYKTASWVKEFREKYLLNCCKEQTFFVCTMVSLMSHWNKLGTKEALRMALTLKSYAEEEPIIVCKPPDKLHETICYPYDENHMDNI